MPFAPVNALEEVLCRAISDPAARPRFFAMMMQSPLYALGKVRNHTDIDVALCDLSTQQFDLRRVRIQGRHYHPIFTAPDRILALSKEPEPYFAVQGHTLFAHTRGAAFLLNLGSEVGKELLPQDIDRLLGPRPVLPEVVIGQARPYPSRLASALSILFLNRFQVSAAYLAQADISGQDLPHYLIGLVASGDMGRLTGEIRQVAAAIKIPNTIDTVVLDPANTGDELAMRMLAQPSFYARPIKPH
jgi:hypothetical protein